MDNDSHQAPEQTDADQAILLGHLGTALRDARMQRGLELPALARQLCMGEEQLAALESADQSKLPEPVFVIAQSRRVANALGVDISLLIAPLKATAAVAASNSVGSTAAAATGRRLDHRRRRPGGSLRWLGGTALIAGVAAAGVWAWPSIQRLPHPSLSSLAGWSIRPKAAPPAAPAPKPRVPASATVPAGQLLVMASQPSWLEVQTSQRQLLFKGSFKGERRFPLAQGLTVLAGRPDLVRVQVAGGPARPLGRIDQIRWVHFPAAAAPVSPPAAADSAPAP